MVGGITTLQPLRTTQGRASHLDVPRRPERATLLKWSTNPPFNRFSQDGPRFLSG
jgi:hypothetical protein